MRANLLNPSLLTYNSKTNYGMLGRGLGQAKLEPAATGGFGLAHNLCKPEPSQAGPEPGLLGQAGPAQH
jgi:hypothetical protein